jgi:hypothetical protein
MGGNGLAPISFVAIHRNVSFARVGLQEDDCHVLLYGGGTRAGKIEVIEEPREGSAVLACASLYCLVWLFNDSRSAGSFA